MRDDLDDDLDEREFCLGAARLSFVPLELRALFDFEGAVRLAMLKSSLLIQVGIVADEYDEMQERMAIGLTGQVLILHFF